MAHRPAASSRKCGGSPGSTAVRTRSPKAPGSAAYRAALFPSMSISQPMQQLWRQAPAVQRNAS